MIDAGIHWFNGLGFRPAVWTASHRADGVDPQRIIPAPDADIAFVSKFDAWDHIPTAYTWGTWLPQPAAPVAQVTAAGLAGPVPGPAPFTAGPLIPGPWEPLEPEWPCCIITSPPTEPELPQPAPVPLEASGLFMLTGLAVLWWWGRK